ncbi:hypothetical protein SLS64_002139 [Diaporthe eres]|uniref:Uncharacterized protein n=1 Tax=Diaporthe eres TaxID=83184 RepID=A0ABR1PNJ4_DIAER
MPAATAKPAQRGATPLNKQKLNGRKAPTSGNATIQSEVHDARSDSNSKLPKPLGPKARRIITKKTSTLIRKRNELDRALLRQTFKPLDELSVNDWLPREEILRQCERMASRERDYIRERTKALEERTALYNQDPSEERALDLNLIRNQLWKFKRHLGPYLEAAEEPRGDGEGSVSSSDSDQHSSDDESGLVQAKADDSTSSVPSEGDPSNGNAHEEKPSIGLDGAFDDVRNSKKRRRNDVSETREESQKKARKERTSGSTQSTTSQSQSSKAGAPKRSKEMEASLSQILNNMSQTKSSQASINGASKAETEEEPVEATTTKGTSEKANRTAPKTPASSSNSNASDGDARPWYQRHAKAMLRPDFDDFVREGRRGYKPKKKRREYLVSGAIPVPHLPSPRPDKAKARSASTDGP